MDARTLISELSKRGIRLIPNPPKLIAVPAAKLTDKDCEAIRSHKAGLLALLREQAETDRTGREDAEIDRLARVDGWQPNPAEPSVATCQRYGVALRIDPDGALLVGKIGATADQPSQP